MFDKRPKELGIILFVCLYSLIVFGAFAISLTFRDGWLFMLAVGVLVVALIGWVSIISLAAMLTAHHRFSSLAVSVVPSLALAIIGMGSLISIVAALLLAGIVYSGQKLIVREIDDRISFKVPRIFRVGIRVIASGLLISLLGLTLPIFIDTIDQDQLSIPEQYVESLLLPLDPLVDNLFPGYDKSQTIDEMIEDKFRDDFGPNVTMTPQQKEEVRQGMSSQMGTDLEGQETLSTIVAERINSYLQYLLEFNPALIAGGLIILAFLTLRVLIPVVVWPALGIIYVLVWLMLKYRFISKEFKQIPVERLRL